MSNDFYNATGKPTQGASLVSADMRSEFAAIESGVSEKLPALAGNAGKMVRVNSGETALEATGSDSGSFDAVFTASGAAPPTITFAYALVGAIASLSIIANGGTFVANSVNFATAVGALPAALRPVAIVTSPAFPGFVDAGSGVQAALRVGADGKLEFLIVTGSSYGAWTASGNRSASGLTVTYPLGI